ncbi:TonB-dependent siderophore receptor [Rheinheimera marina]|uniref:TonB-dependent siderophore receptor n=1 Tax=Rheinheimera marina TaxID=1774958 RepID=A0ABV9JG52_9GAMM
MSNTVKFRKLPLVVATQMALFSMAAVAADKTEKDVERIEVVGKYTVTENIDTATGLGLSLRETPQSVSVLTEQRLKDQNINTVLETVKNAVGVSATEVDNVRSSFKARGFEVTNYQIDGVPLAWSLAGDSGETVADVAIYERVEFVRGATGLLTGAGEPSASINLVRKHADSTALKGNVDVQTGSWNRQQLTADVASGLNRSGTLRGRVVGKYLKSDSYWDQFEDNSNVLYGVLEADLSNSTLIRVGGSYQNRDPKAATWGALPAMYSDGTYIDWDTSKTTGADWTRWETTNTNYFANLNHSFANGWQLVANYNRMAYEKDSKLLYLYGAVDKATGEGLSAQRYRAYGESDQNSFDVQLKGDYQLFNQSHEFVVGAITSTQDIETDSYTPIGGDMSGGYDRVDVGNFYQWAGLPQPEWENTPVRAEDVTIKQKGLYAATRISATDALKFIVGGRVSSWDREGIWYGAKEDYGNNGEFVPYVGALLDLTEQHRLYASYTEIFKAQDRRDKNNELLDPVSGKSYELGLKSSFLDDRLNTTVAVFQIQQDNLAVVDSTFVPNAEQQTAYYGADGTESKGFELEVVGKPIEGWNISAGYSQFEAEDAYDLKVNTDSPRKQFKLFTTYQFVDALPELTVGGGVNWQSETYAEGGGARLTQQSYSLVNLMARYDVATNLNLQLNVANLLDEKYYNYMTAWGTSYTMYRYGTPRNLSFSVNYAF